MSIFTPPPRLKSESTIYTIMIISKFYLLYSFYQVTTEHQKVCLSFNKLFSEDQLLDKYKTKNIYIGDFHAYQSSKDCCLDSKISDIKFLLLNPNLLNFLQQSMCRLRIWFINFYLKLINSHHQPIYIDIRNEVVGLPSQIFRQ